MGRITCSIKVLDYSRKHPATLCSERKYLEDKWFGRIKNLYVLDQ